MPAWVIDDPESPVGTDNGTADYWKHTCGITEDGVQTAPDTVTYVRTTEPPYAPNQEKEAFRVCTSTISGGSVVRTYVTVSGAVCTPSSVIPQLCFQ